MRGLAPGRACVSKHPWASVLTCVHIRERDDLLRKERVAAVQQGQCWPFDAYAEAGSVGAKPSG
eukprot:5505051-Alexandrium_andersonii.AAC.1